MRIKTLRLSNINSLKGRQLDIDFSPEGKLGQEGLFIITGPTGSGKTSILDAICAALYGQTPRLTPGKDMQNLMSRHTNSCFAEVEFEINNQVYRSHWSLKKNRNGNFNTADMELSLIKNGIDEILETKIKNVVAKVEEITGLDFKRFTRSIMLAQGDFATFINSKPDERGKLLEKITGTEIYTEISQKVHERTKEEKNKRELFKKNIEKFDLTDPEILKNKENEKELNEKKLKEIEKKLDHIAIELKQLEEFDELNFIITKSKNELDNNKALENQNKELFYKLERYESIRNIESEFYLLKSKKKDQEKLFENSEKWMQILKESEKKHDVAKESFDVKEKETSKYIDHINSYKEKLLKAENLDDLKKSKEKENYDIVKLCDDTKLQIQQLQENYKSSELKLKEISNQRNQLEEYLNNFSYYKELGGILPVANELFIQYDKIIRTFEAKKLEKNQSINKLSSLHEQIDLTIHELNRRKGQLDNKSEKKIDLEKELKILTNNTSKNEIENSYLKNQEIILQLDKIVDLEKDSTSLQSEIISLEIRNNQTKKELKALEKETKKLAHEIEINTINLKQLELEKEKQIKQKNYESDRQNLKVGEPCPLCGSTEHKINDLNVIPISEIEQQIIDIKKKIKELQNELGKSNEGFTRLEQTIFHNDKEQNKISNQLLELDGKKGEMINQNHFKDILDFAAYLERLNVEQKKYQDNLKKIQETDSEVEAINLAINQLEKDLIEIEYKSKNIKKELENEDSKLNTIDSEVEEILNSKKVLNEKISNLLKQYNDNNLNDLKGIEKKIKELTKLYEDYKLKENNYKEIVEQITKIENNLEKLSLEMNNLMNRYDEKVNKNKELQKEIESIQKERESLVNKVSIDEEKKKIEKQIKVYQDELKYSRENLENFRIELEKANENVNFLNEEIKNNTNEIKVKEDSFFEKLSSFGLNSETEFENLLLDDKKVKEIVSLKESIQNNHVKYSTRIDDANAKIDDLIKKVPDIQNKKFNEKSIEKNDLEIEIDKIRKSNMEVEIEIRNIKKQFAEVKEIQEEFNRHEKDYQIWALLDKLIGSADGKQFRNIAQGITLNFLIDKANYILHTFNNRYSLSKDENEYLNIKIIDHYQADTIRTMNTLSGGESFLVSLALALSLSQLASKKTRVDSLFIDEGFGTLDIETLDVALSALSQVKDSGKLIGIISHIEILKERIAAQIQVYKLSGGQSKYRLA